MFVLAGTRLDFTGGNDPGAVGHHADPAPFEEWGVLQRKHDGREVKPPQRAGACAEIVAICTRMDSVPKRVEPIRYCGNRYGESTEIPIEDRKPCPHDQ